MNSVFNTYMQAGGAPQGNMPTFEQQMNSLNQKKQNLSLQPDSLFSMALYDFEGNGDQSHEIQAPSQQSPMQGNHFQGAPQLNQFQANQLKRPGHFYPVDEYKDLSLREILEISDDLIFDGSNNSSNDNSNVPNVFDLQQAQQQLQQGNLPTVIPGPTAMQQLPVVSVDAAQPQMVGSLCKAEVNANNNDIDLSPKKKRRRSDNDSADGPDGGADGELGPTGRRFRPYQAGQWSEKFEELCAYREQMGHCLVPHTYSENLPLARWVKRQRYRFKLMRENKSSTMTDDRVRALEEIGFVWDSQGAAWGERLAELREFRQEFLHCNVPSNFADNPQLATWVKCQRRQYKLHAEGKPSNMTPQRIGELESLGFEWELRSYKKARTTVAAN